MVHPTDAFYRPRTISIVLYSIYDGPEAAEQAGLAKQLQGELHEFFDTHVPVHHVGKFVHLV